jgi:hypothetical protein
VVGGEAVADVPAVLEIALQAGRVAVVEPAPAGQHVRVSVIVVGVVHAPSHTAGWDDTSTPGVRRVNPTVTDE